MNDRIKELAKLAEKYANEFPEECTNKYVDVWHSVYSKKFAELIVRECVLCCERVISDPVPKSVDTWLNGGSQCIEEIKEHFGVE